MVPVCSSVMLELVLAVHSYHVIAYPDYVLIAINHGKENLHRGVSYRFTGENVNSMFDSHLITIFEFVRAKIWLLSCISLVTI